MKKGSLIGLFCTMGKIGCVGFGGGNALIPILQKTIVEEAELVEQNEFDEDVVVANITPGALPVEVAGGIGRRIAGWKGMLAGSVGMAFPGVVATVLLLASMTYLNREVLRQIEFVTVGITAFITCLLTNYIVGVLKHWPNRIVVLGVFGLTCGKNLLRLLGVDKSPMFGLSAVHIFALTFFLIFFTQCRKSIWRISVATILGVLYVLCTGKTQYIASKEVYGAVCILMIVLACLGVILQFRREKRIGDLQLKETGKEILALIVLFVIAFVAANMITEQAGAYLGNSFVSSVMSFGGGDAYLTVAEGMFVNTELVAEGAFYGNIVPLVNILPGSILCKTVSAVGYCVGYSATQSVLLGYLVAMAGFACSIVASCGVFAVVGCIYQGFGKMEVFQLIKRWIRPIVAGLMLTVILALVYQNRKMGCAEEIGWVPVLGMLGIYGIDLYLYYKKKTANWKIILVSIVLSFILCNIYAM